MSFWYHFKSFTIPSGEHFGSWGVHAHTMHPPPGKNIPLRNVQKRREISTQIYRQKRMCTYRSRPMYHWPTTPNIVGPNNVVTCCIRLHGTTTMLALVAYSLKLVKLLGQQVPMFLILLFCDRQSVVQQCCTRLHGTTTMLSNIGLVKASAHAPCNNFFKKQS